MKLALSTILSLIIGVVIGISYQGTCANVAPAPTAEVSAPVDAVPAPRIVEVPATVGNIPFGWNGVVNAAGKPQVGVVGTEQRFAILKQELDEARLPDDRIALMREIAALPPIYSMKANIPRNYLAKAQSHVVVLASYHVTAGDSLSKISTVLKADMDAIFLANPQAFINGDPNLLMAGVDLKMPEKS